MILKVLLFILSLLSVNARPNGSPICTFPASIDEFTGMKTRKFTALLNIGGDATVTTTPFQAKAGEDLSIKIETGEKLLGFLVRAEIGGQAAGEFVHPGDSSSPASCSGAEAKATATHSKLIDALDFTLTYKVPASASGSLKIRILALTGPKGMANAAQQTFYSYSKDVTIIAAPVPTPKMMAPMPTPKAAVTVPMGDVVIRRGHSWHYWNNGMANPAWQGKSFKPDDWQQGASPIGYGDANFQFATEFPEIITESAYFRTTVMLTADQISKHQKYTLRACINGRSVISVNGNRVEGMDQEAVAKYWNVEVFRPIDDWFEGENFVTIEVINDQSSEDLVFDVEMLLGQHTPSPTPMPPTPAAPTPGAAGAVMCGNGKIEGDEECESMSGDCCGDDCKWKARGATCDDNNAMTVDDQCGPNNKCAGLFSGDCSADPSVCDVDNNPCSKDNCVNGKCERQGFELVGAPCDDNNPCTKDDACTQQSFCVGEDIDGCGGDDPGSIGWQQPIDCPVGQLGCSCTWIGKTCDDGIACNTKTNKCGASSVYVAMTTMMVVIMAIMF